MRDGTARFPAILGLLAVAAGCSDGGGSSDVVADPGTEEVDGGGEVVPDGGADADSSEETEADAEPEADVDPDVAPDADSAADADLDADAVPDVEPEADADSSAETEADVVTPPAPECVDAAACSLFTDCCNCLALAPGETPPPCGITTCFVTTCTPRGITDADVTCAAGRCAAGYDCDPSSVVCAMPPPACAAGEVPSVRGGCWGACVPATECSRVTDCGQCAPELQFCVRDVTRMGPIAHCVERLDECGAVPSCECAGASVCVAAFYLCGDDAAGPMCNCPTCG